MLVHFIFKYYSNTQHSVRQWLRSWLKKLCEIGLHALWIYFGTCGDCGLWEWWNSRRRRQRRETAGTRLLCHNLATPKSPQNSWRRTHTQTGLLPWDETNIRRHFRNYMMRAFSHAKSHGVVTVTSWDLVGWFPRFSEVAKNSVTVDIDGHSCVKQYWS